MAKRICALIGATLMLIVLVFNTFVFAMPLNNAVEDSTNDRLLLVPRRTTVRHGNTASNISTYGQLFDTNPMYKYDVDGYNTRTWTTYINGPAGSWNGSLYMTHYTRQYQHIYWAQEQMHRFYGYLSRERSEPSGVYAYATQFDFESFRIRSGVDTFAWCVQKVNEVQDYIDIRIEFVTYNESDGYGTKVAQDRFNYGSLGYVSIKDIYELAVENGAYEYYDGGILFKSMSIVNYTDDGSICINESDTSVGNSVYQYLIFPLIEPVEDNLPDFIGWLADTVGGFFDTTIFKFADIEVTMGTLIIIPLSLSLLIIFLKKFAGG